MSGDDIAIKVSDLSKCYHIYDKPHDRLKQSIYPRLQRLAGKQPKQYCREFWALKDVSFEIKKGETVGIVGRNGSGKSTLLQLICGTLHATSGTIETQGRIAALLELGSGFNPEFTGRENVYMNGAILGLSQVEIESRYSQIVEFADIGEFIDRPVKIYSSGMLMRLAFATQTVLDPKILIVDEALAVGDMSFQVKCFARMNQLREKGTTILFVSHSLSTVLSFCDRAVYLQRGEQIATGPVADVVKQYQQDCMAEKMAPRDSAAFAESTLTALMPESDSSAVETEQLASAARDYHHTFLACSEKGSREGSRTVTIESFVIVRPDGIPIESVSPTEEVAGCFLLKYNARFEGAIHLAIQVLDKCGSPVMVIRDSHFESAVSAVPGKLSLGVMRFTLPLQAGIYYCKIGVVVYPMFEKYKDGRHNMEQAEISDLIEYGATIRVLDYVRHPIPVPVLNESKLSLTSLGGP